MHSKHTPRVDPLPGSPIPILAWKRRIFKIVMNDCCLFIFRVKTWLYPAYEGEFYKELSFPWFMMSLLFTVNLLLIDNPGFIKFKREVDLSSFFFIIIFMRIVFVVLIGFKQNEDEAVVFLGIHHTVMDVSNFTLYGLVKHLIHSVHSPIQHTIDELYIFRVNFILLICTAFL